MILGGIEVEYHLGLDGHSDADVLTHAVMDAILGAAGLWDIGHAFPDSNPAWKDISSILLLQKVMEMIGERGYTVGNVDATVVAQRPKLAPCIPQMRDCLAQAMGIPKDCVNIKATTEEYLGFTGQEMGMAAHAVALLEKK